MIDLHTHTTESDGTLTPAELVAAAAALQLEALGISDHDTFTGYDAALPFAQSAGLELICGIELSTRSHGKSVHLLGYFLRGGPAAAFRAWIVELQESRRERNARLIEKLQSLGVAITLAEVEDEGRTLTARPHFARVLIRKGYVKTIEEAFEVYLDESARAYVQRREVLIGEAIARVIEAGGLPVLAHPVRLGKRSALEEEQVVRDMVEQGLPGIEVWHSDHSPADVERYLTLARKYNLAMTGGSDFHGANKPAVQLGVGRNNLRVPGEVLTRLRAAPRYSHPD